MGDHRTLDEFARDHSEDDPESAEESGNDENVGDDQDQTVEDAAVENGPSETGASSQDVSAVEPPATTYQWTPDGAACANCGAVVERRWRDDGAFVCADCKEW